MLSLTHLVDPWTTSCLLGVDKLCVSDQRPKPDLHIHEWTEKKEQDSILNHHIISASWKWEQHWIWWAAACVLGWDLMQPSLVTANSITRSIKMQYYCIISVLWCQNIALHLTFTLLCNRIHLVYMFSSCHFLHLYMDCNSVSQMENKYKQKSIRETGIKQQCYKWTLSNTPSVSFILATPARAKCHFLDLGESQLMVSFFKVGVGFMSHITYLCCLSSLCLSVCLSQSVSFLPKLSEQKAEQRCWRVSYGCKDGCKCRASHCCFSLTHYSGARQSNSAWSLLEILCSKVKRAKAMLDVGAHINYHTLQVFY